MLVKWMGLMKRLVALISFLLALLPIMSFAHTYRASGATVYINEYPVFTLRATLNGRVPAKRAQVIVDTIKKGIEWPLTIVESSPDYWIKYGSLQVVRVTPQEAKQFEVPQKELLATWMKNLETALKLPALFLDKDSLTLNYGESVPVPLMGSEVADCDFSCEDNMIAIAKRTERGIEVEGIAPGETTALFKSDHGTVSLKIIVKGTKPVAMNPAGNTGTRITIDGSNRKIQPESELWCSNFPETVTREGTVFSRELAQGRPVRLLYHHMNGSAGPLALEVVVYNRSTLPSTVFVIDAQGVPDSDPVRTGLDAGQQFLKAWLGQSGRTIVIPGRTKMPIAISMLSQGTTLSGLAHIHLISGASKLLVQTEVENPRSIDPAWIDAARDPSGTTPAEPAPFTVNPPESEKSPHVFVAPFRDSVLQYSVTGRNGVCRIGEPQDALTQADPWDGGYGVLTKIQATLTNPTRALAKVEIVFEASAGYAGALFAIDGVIQSGSIVRTKDTKRIVMISLNPGEQRKLSLLTIPVSGSSYPATLTARIASTSSADDIFRSQDGMESFLSK